MNLQPLFSSPVLEQIQDPGYTDHASDVWIVRTADEEAVVRLSRITAYPANDFHEGAWRLFGVDPRRVWDLKLINQALRQVSLIPVPRVLRKGMLEGRPCLVVERMDGRALRSFTGQPDALLEQFGRVLASIHSRSYPWCGNPAGSFCYPCAEFPAKLAATIRKVAEFRYPAAPAIQAALEPMCRAAEALEPPGAGALIMLDLDPTQFLTEGERLTALVDTEFYGVGPRELDLIACEYVLDPPAAAAVARGYRSVMPLPDLAAVRPVYRFLHLLMAVQGHVLLVNGWPGPSSFLPERPPGGICFMPPKVTIYASHT